jgi:hypothetical protein
MPLNHFASCLQNMYIFVNAALCIGFQVFIQPKLLKKIRENELGCTMYRYIWR